MEISASKYFYYYDALGSVHNLTDSAGSKVATYHYDIFGAFQLIGSLHNNLYTFTGRKYDPESGLYYYRARYYSPGLGRFLQVDPAGYEDGPNLFTYVSNLPISYYDPYGLAIFEKGYLCPKSAQFWIDPYDECPSGWARVFEECYWWCWICLGREIKKFDDYDCNYTYECLFFGHPAIPPDGSTWA
jgi:RHS repeat-associated protein